MKASIIILNWNGDSNDCIEACESALGQSHPDKEILFIDNGSTNGSTEMVDSAQLDIRILYTGENLGVASGRNFGADAATGDFLFFLENDGVWEDNSLVADILHLFQSNPDMGAVYTKVIGYKNKELQSAAYLPDSPQLTSVAVFSGGACAIRRDVFERCGKFPADFFRQGEERFFSLLVYEENYKICYWIKHCLLHKGSNYAGKNLVVNRLNFEHELKTVARLFPDKCYRSLFFLKLMAWSIRFFRTGDILYFFNTLPKIFTWLNERNSYPHVSMSTLSLTEAIARGDYANTPAEKFVVADAKRELANKNVLLSNFKRWATR